MAMDAKEPIGPVTFEEYLALEEAGPIKHELVAGFMYEYNGGESRGLAGATRRHNRIAGNIFGRLWNAVGGGPCQVYGSDMRLRTSAETTYYPDVQVVCDPTDADEQFTTRPCLIVEVLSPSTASIDRREKVLEYQSLESLSAYLIVWADQRRCMLHYREPQKRWSSILTGPRGDVQLPCPELRMSLDEIYAGVEIDDT
jgi:Uma2 family endonuclease